ncbi:MAG TPA: zf-HC2 domain-containing protein [Myxococcota bacterium]|nr:zf-HC2 domain-containing protein [Myxococcota bacterium]
MDCREVDKFLQVYIDGELDEADRRRLQEHLYDCKSCRAAADYERRFKQAVKVRWPRSAAPDSLKERVVEGMAQTPRRHTMRRRLVFSSVPAAVALALVITFTWTVTSGFSPLLKEAVLQHSTEPPVEVSTSDRSTVEEWFRKKVDFHVALPRFGHSRVSLVGARLSHLAERQAALVSYRSGGDRFSLFVLTDTGGDLDGRRCKKIESTKFCISEQRGYTVVLWRSRGLMYSLVGDSDPREMLRVIAAELSH